MPLPPEDAEKLVEASHGTVAEKPWPKRYSKDDSVLSLSQTQDLNVGSVVRVNKDKIGIVSKVILNNKAGD